MQWIGPALSVALWAVGIALATVYGSKVCAKYCASVGQGAPSWNQPKVYAFLRLILTGLGACCAARWVLCALAGYLAVPLLCDFACHRLPRLWVYGGGLVAIATLAANFRQRIIPTLVWAVVIFLGFAALAGVAKIGFGDVRLAPIALAPSAAIATEAPAWAIAVALLIAGGAALVAIARTRNAMTHIALGPYLILGGYLAPLLF